MQQPTDQSVGQREDISRQYLDIALIPGQYLDIALVAMAFDLPTQSVTFMVKLQCTWCVRSYIPITYEPYVHPIVIVNRSIIQNYQHVATQVPSWNINIIITISLIHNYSSWLHQTGLHLMKVLGYVSMWLWVTENTHKLKLLILLNSRDVLKKGLKYNDG